MSEKIELDLDAIEAAAKAATPQDFVSAQVAGAEEGWMECPGCGGEGSVEVTADYLNYDGQALGVQFYGIGDPHVHAEAHYRAARPAVVLAMVEEIKTLRDNYGAAVMRIKELDLLFGRYLLGMRAAVIEWQNGKGAEAGMEWVWNGLAGPGELPPKDQTQAQAYFDREVVPIETGLEEVYAFLEKRRAAKQAKP